MSHQGNPKIILKARELSVTLNNKQVGEIENPTTENEINRVKKLNIGSNEATKTIFIILQYLHSLKPTVSLK